MNEEIAASCVFRFAAKNYNPLRNVWSFARPAAGGGGGGCGGDDAVGGVVVEPVRICNLGMKKVIQAAGRNGVLKSFQSVQGSPESHVQFTDAPLREYTLFHLCRYQQPPPLKPSSARGRILNSIDGDWFSGFWKGHEGVSFHGDDWLAAPRDPPPSLPPRVEEPPTWLLSTDCPHRYRRNGKALTLARESAGDGDGDRDRDGDEDGDGDPLPPFGINFPASVPWERSHFELADIILYDRVLPLAEIERVEAFLACEYGIREMILMT